MQAKTRKVTASKPEVKPIVFCARNHSDEYGDDLHMQSVYVDVQPIAALKNSSIVTRVSDGLMLLRSQEIVMLDYDVDRLGSKPAAKAMIKNHLLTSPALKGLATHVFESANGYRAMVDTYDMGISAENVHRHLDVTGVDPTYLDMSTMRDRFSLRLTVKEHRANGMKKQRVCKQVHKVNPLKASVQFDNMLNVHRSYTRSGRDFARYELA